MYLLDTSACVEVLRHHQSKVKKRLEQHDPAEVFLCAAVVAELFYGARKSAKVVKNLSLVREFCAPFVSLPFDDRCAEHYGILRAELESIGARIGANDLFVASIVKTYDLILVTQNIKDFSRIAGLQVEDWL